MAGGSRHVASQSVRAVPHHGRVLLLVALICSDEECAELVDEPVGSLDELDGLSCDCGCTHELLAVSLDALPPVAMRRELAPAA